MFYNCVLCVNKFLRAWTNKCNMWRSGLSHNSGGRCAVSIDTAAVPMDIQLNVWLQVSAMDNL